ncbi:MAG: phosphopantetheine-binding protein [Anaplasmataceae bacterium]|nr:phosphopantetheine-binding protein [Anaplasmataceae bacterium]
MREAITKKVLDILDEYIESSGLKKDNCSDDKDINSEISEQKANILINGKNILDLHLVDEVGLDSLSLVELLMSVDEEFGISIEEDVAEHLNNSNELIDKVVELIQADKKYNAN